MNVAVMSKQNLATAGFNGELAPTRQSLLERLRNLEDNASWQEFFESYWKLIYSAAVKGGLSDSEAEEVVQETMIGVARNMEGFCYEPEKCSFKGWLMHLTRRRIIDRLRRRQTQPQHFVQLPGNRETGTNAIAPGIADTAAEDDFEGMWDQEWQNNLLNTAMAKVKEAVKAEHYQIFYMFCVNNMRARDIAELTGASIAKVHVVRYRVSRLLKEEVARLKNKMLNPNPTGSLKNQTPRAANV